VRTHRFWVSWLAIGLNVGCASISEFRVHPLEVCAGEAVSVHWDVFGRATLKSSPELPGTGPQPSEGTRSFQVPHSTRFTLKVWNVLRDTSADADVNVEPLQPLSYGAIASCDANTRVIAARLDLDQQVGSGLRVGSVANPLDRALEIEKDARRVSLAPGAKSDALNGLAARGAWQLDSRLAQGESCDSALRSLRQRLEFTFYRLCTR